VQNIDLSIIIPCLNEEKTLTICIDKARLFLKKENICGEIIVGDNGSNDNSISIANQLADKVIHVQIKGYGSVLQELIKSTNGKYIIMGDADDSYDFSDLTGFYTKLLEGHQLVVGNRFKGGIEKGAMPFINRFIGNPIISFLGKTLFRVPLNDFNCGLRGFESKAMNQLKFESTGMEFASEMIIVAKLKGLSIIEVPIKLFPDGRQGKSHLQPFRDGIRHVFLIIKLKFRK
jgi:glycosyltransferase involved in cell wall biosynthesis